MSAVTYFLNESFKFQNGVLHCEGLNLSELVQSGRLLKDFAISTPCFVYSKKQLLHNIQQYKNAFAKRKMKYVINYSMKANMNPQVLKIMKEHGLSLTLVSGMELRLANEVGFQTEALVMNGNGKLDWEVELAIEYDALLNIDSVFNMKQTIRLCKKLGRRARILLRVNPDIKPDVHQYVSTGQEGSKFGVSTGELQDVLHLIESTDAIDLVGLHCHLGSTISDTQVFRRCAILLVDIIDRLKERGFKSLIYINIGGGLAIPYRCHSFRTKSIDQLGDDIKTKLNMSVDDVYPETARVNLQDLLKKNISLYDLLSCIKDRPEYERVTAILKQLLTIESTGPTPEELLSSIDDIIPDHMTLIVEPGRSLIGNTAVLLCTVLGTKSSGSKNFVVVDGAMTEVIRPCLYGAYHHIETAEIQPTSGEKQVYDVVGPVCESADYLGKDRLLHIPRDGSVLAVFDVGAYCSSMASNYNMRVRPNEILVVGESITVMRKADTYEDLVRPYVF